MRAGEERRTDLQVRPIPERVFNTDDFLDVRQLQVRLGESARSCSAGKRGPSPVSIRAPRQRRREP